MKPAGYLIILAGLAAIFAIAFGLRRLARRSREDDRQALLAAPLASFELDVSTLVAYRQWQIADLERERAALGKRALKISVWLLAILLPGFSALGLWRTSIASGALIGLSFSALIIGPVLLVCAGLAVKMSWVARRLRSDQPTPTRMLVGTQGIAFEPGEFQPLYGTPFVARILKGPPLVFDLISRFGSGKNTSYQHARGPIPADRQHDAWATLKELRKRWNMPPD